MRHWLGTVLLASVLVVLCSCGSTTHCELAGVKVTPASGSANHLAAAPGNQVQFGADGTYKGDCAIAACVNCLPNVTWSVSDPTNVSLAPGQVGPASIEATCTGATNGAVTLTATQTDSSTGRKTSGTATLTCQ